LGKLAALETRPSFPQWPHYAEDEIAAVTAVLHSGKVNYWTGNECRAFEKDYAEHCGSKHAVAVANGTLALELALRAIGIRPGDEVITTARTFIASASSAVACGARPVCADVDRESQNLTAASIERVITPRTRAIVVVHLAGWPADMDPIMDLADSRGLKVIEDCAQANGASYKGRPVGSIGHAGAFSFCQDKIITTGGEGGLLVTNDADIWRYAWEYKDHGKSWTAVHERAHSPGFRWVHESFGTNWRLTEMQGVIGRAQLRKLPDWVAARRRNANHLRDRLNDLPLLRIPLPSADVHHSYYRLYVFVRRELLANGWTRDRILTELMGRGIPCAVGSCSEIYREQAFARSGWAPDQRLGVAEELGETSLAFLVHPTLEEAHMETIAQNVREVVLSATR
jgi:dTDP-4-amino-4,6-dideoxygalactose transaminase